ncbi:S8 family serine peptidase [Aneurinibacillus danicus]|uniref:SLH domain-containing protein n=1 Tax=Aneurinibacillus danicus TaxID=267746 RepID=A0A511V5P8_9BACL|nr:S8 family serine peptidase [Aneurinibacillus danicus]GEN33248.1 hypothetical protein ADA01nite_07080 [Aneurinibacillus danicus]
MLKKKNWHRFVGSLLSFVFVFTMLFPLGTGQALEAESVLETTAASDEENRLADGEETTSADSIIVDPVEPGELNPEIIASEKESPGEIIVKYKKGKEEQAKSTLAVMGIEEVEQSDSGISLYTLQPGEDMAQVIEELEQNPAVEYAEPNQEYTVFSDISGQEAITDEYFDQQWALKNIKAEEAWEKVKELSGTVKVAVIDTGVDDSHPDLEDRVLQGKNFAERKSDGTLYPENRDSKDDHGHGTQVAGIISALYNNQKGIAGAAGLADVKIYPVKVMHDKGAGSTFDIANGIQYAADQGVDIINLSLGGKYSQAIEQAVKYAQNKGILVVAAAGNSATNVDAVYPAALPDVVTVGAITQDKDKIADFSNQGSALDVVAPGVDIITTTIKEKGTLGDESKGYYAKVSGTSFAAPYAAAVAALYKLQNPGAAASDIAYAMTAAATDLGTAGRDNTYGYGKLNAAKTLDPLTDPEQRPAIEILEPAKNGHVMGEVSIQARVSGETINTVRFYLDEVNEEKLIALVNKQGEQTLYNTTWDTKKIADGSHTVWAVASNGETEIGRTSVPVIVNNSPTNGLMLNVLDPEGNRAPGAKVSIYTKVPVAQEGTPVPSSATAPYTYKLLWSGSTDSLGVVRVPGTIVTDLTTVSIVVYGGFDYADAAQGNTVFLYNQTVEGPGVFTIRGEETVPVTLNTLGENQKKLENTKYFATLIDDNGITVGTTTALNEEDSAISTVFMNKGKYNLFAYNKAAEATYFLHERAKQISQATTIVFDGSKAGEVGLAPGNDENKIVNGILYMFSEGTEETIGINDEALVGRKLRVTPGSYDFWADVEVKDPAGGQNWIYVFGTGETGERLVEIPANGKVSIPVGGTLALTEFAPDVEELKNQLKKAGKEYVPQEDEFTVQKSYDYFFTKHKFTDAYGNLLVGMYRGSLEGSGLWKKQNMNGENPTVSRLDEQSNSWQTQEYYFGDIYPNFKVTRQGGSTIYNNKFRQFYYWAFWAVVLPTVTPGKYDVELKLQYNPLAGKELTGHMVNTVKDDRKYKTMKTTLNGKPFAANVTIYHSVEEGGEMIWEKSFAGKANATTGELAIEDNIKLSSKKNGNLAKIIYILTDKEYGAANKGEYLFAFRQFTTLDELQEIKLENMQRVEINAQDQDGKAIQNPIRRDRGIIFPGQVEGQKVPFYQFTGNDYKKEVAWLEPGTYHFDGHYIVGTGEGKKVNYYLFQKDVIVSGSEGAVNKVLLDGTDTAKIVFEPDTAGYHDFRGVSLFPFNPYRHEMNELNTVGHTFYLAADIPYHLDTKLTLGDKENPAYTWNYFLEEAKEQPFARGTEKIWHIGKFVPQLSLDKTTIKGTEAVTGRSGIVDKHGNKVVYTFIDKDSSWSAAAGEAEKQGSLAVRLQANGQIKVNEDVEYSISHEETKPAGPSVTEIYPYLRVYKKQADGKETRIFNESKPAYYDGFSESLGNLGPGNYRVEVAFASGPNGPVTTALQEGTFTVLGSGSGGSGSGGSGGGGGSVQPTPDPAKEGTKSVSDNQINQAVKNALDNNASVIRIESDKAAAVSLTINQLKTIEDTKKALEIKFNGVTFTIPSAVLTGLPIKDAATIEFSATALNEADAKNVTDAAENAAMVKKVVGAIFELRVTAVTKAGEAVGIKTFTEQLQVNLPVPKEDQAAALAGQVHAHRFNPDTKRWDYIGGTYNPATHTISFVTSKFSRFALLITDEVMQTFELTDLRGHWAEQDIQFMVSQGYVRGIGDGKFAPNSPITRAEFTALLTRILGLQEDKDSAITFKDLGPGHWAYGSVQAAAKAGFISGYKDGCFYPDQKITRQEISALITRALKYKQVENEISEQEKSEVLGKFKDRKEISLWAEKEVAAAVKAGIAVGRKSDEYAPRADTTRAEGVVLLKRALDKINKTK